MNELVFLSIGLPFVASWLSLFPQWKSMRHWLLPLAPIPGLFLSLVSSDVHVFVPDLLLGAHLGLDVLGRAFLLLTTLIWFIAGLYAVTFFDQDSISQRFQFFFLLTLCGNVGTVLSLDVASFYTFFALMSLSAYGLVSLNGTQRALSAGKFYMWFTIVGEMLIFSGIALSLYQRGTSDFLAFKSAIQESGVQNWVYALFFVGFGIKVGLVPFQAWLPRTYYAAPIPAVVVFSGAMSKAGVLGWLRFLPWDVVSSTSWSITFMLFGMLTVTYGAFVGIVQTNTRSALSYSSLSQMGYCSVLLGLGFSNGVDPLFIQWAFIAFAFYHGFSKTGQFLGADLLAAQAKHQWRRIVLLSMLLIGVLSTIGWPMTAGGYAKSLMKAVEPPHGFWPIVAPAFFALAGAGTILHMTRFYILCLRLKGDHIVGLTRWSAWILTALMNLVGAFSFEMSLRQLGWFEAIQVPFRKTFYGLLPAVLLSISLFGWLRPVILLNSQLTPRPLAGTLNALHRVLFIKMPKEIRAAGIYASEKKKSFLISLKLGVMLRALIYFAKHISTSWQLGTGLLLATWFVIWVLLHNGRGAW